MGRVRGSPAREATGSRTEAEELTRLRKAHEDLLARVRFYEIEREKIRDRLERILRHLPAA